ncbi:MAG: DUF983 domain-containing protein [Actinomycetota bacterium]|nr:DUF983 domain-containing protein [Actinomycetota bacterium]
MSGSKGRAKAGTATGANDATPSLPVLLWRGVRRRCPRCGSAHVFATWFRMVERCPRCGLRFERESDFFLGAYVINLAFTEGLLALALFGYVLRAVAEPGTPLLPVMVVALVFAIAAPLAFFPFSRTIWAAIDLAMRPVPGDDPEPRPGGPGPGTA